MVTNLGQAMVSWLEPLLSMLDTSQLGWDRVAALAAQLDSLVAEHPIGPDLLPGPERSHRLLVIRARLAQQREFGVADQPAIVQVLTQFICGYRDIDLRDAVGQGHGALIARHGSASARDRWLPRMRAGALTGIAMTEPQGGSQPAAIRTRAHPAPDGSWLVSGRKTWISRLAEATVFVVFFRAPDGLLTAATVDAADPGLHRQPLQPAGLSGWSWGVLDLDDVRVCPEDVLDGDGMALMRQHFAGYRPLVTATALGGAAAVFDTVVAALAARRTAGDVLRLRDSALMTVGRAQVHIATALLGAALAARLAEIGRGDAECWGASTKAHGVDIANQVTADLALLLGAAGFRADCQVAKVRRDLNGLLYADGIHDSLYLAAGKQLTAPTVAIPEPRDEFDHAGANVQ